jgi:hypothetical protein
MIVTRKNTKLWSHSPATTAANAASTTNSRAIPTDGYNPKDALGRERLCSEEE